jgi:hypothetical protein
LRPPHTIIWPVHTAVCFSRAAGALVVLVAVQLSVLGCDSIRTEGRFGPRNRSGDRRTAPAPESTHAKLPSRRNVGLSPTYVTRVFLSITDYGVCVSTSKRFTVAIYSDACNNVPDTQIGLSVIAQAPAAPCALASANFGAAGVSVTAGTKYWVVVTTSTAPTHMGTTAVWWMANSAYAPFNLNDGNGWISFPDGAPGGFQVQ